MPVGAVEQHGPHLPLGVDGLINIEIINACRQNHSISTDVLVLPCFWVGRSEEHTAFPGSLTLSAATLQKMWFEVGQSVARAGLRKLIIFNSHGGQIQVMQIVARELRIAFGMFVVGASWFQLGMPENLVSDNERQHGFHAGDVETSMMLAIDKQLVDLAKVQNFQSLTQIEQAAMPILTSLGAAGFGWQAQDLNPHGACGDAGAATAEKGQHLIVHAGARLAALIDEAAHFPLSHLRSEGAVE